jgi:glutamate--cysteine ligase
LWVGLLYHQASLDAAWDLVKDWTAEDRQNLREAVPREALQAKIKGRLVQDVAKDMLALSRHGLGERRIVGCKGKTETRFLNDLDDIAASGRTRADELLQLYDTSWNHDVKRVFRDFAY